MNATQVNEWINRDPAEVRDYVATLRAERDALREALEEQIFWHVDVRNSISAMHGPVTERQLYTCRGLTLDAEKAARAALARCKGTP